LREGLPGHSAGVQLDRAGKYSALSMTDQDAPVEGQPRSPGSHAGTALTGGTSATGTTLLRRITAADIQTEVQRSLSQLPRRHGVEGASLDVAPPEAIRELVQSLLASGAGSEALRHVMEPQFANPSPDYASLAL
jgi:hypothetical protein